MQTGSAQQTKRSGNPLQPEQKQLTNAARDWFDRMKRTTSTPRHMNSRIAVWSRNPITWLLSEPRWNQSIKGRF